MTEDQQPRVVLILGEPGSGKSHLAKQLEAQFGYHVEGLDEVYVDFIRDSYPDFYFNDLGKVIAQHYHYIFPPLTQGAGAAAWSEHVASCVEAACREHCLVSVEGYLLSYALEAVLKRLESLARKAVVTIVEARNRQYFIPFLATIEQIHSGMR